MLARIAGLVLLFAAELLKAQVAAPRSPGEIWQPGEQTAYRNELNAIPQTGAVITPGRHYTLPELIDIAEAHNPETRVVWERAKQCATELGIARSSLYPLLAVAASMTSQRIHVLLASAFYRQDLDTLAPAISLMYTIFDFGARNSKIEASQAELLTSDFLFNEKHEQIIFAVTVSLYQLVSAKGKVAAAQATLENAQTVQKSVEARLKNGLATGPDALEARAATAQAVYDLEAARGAQR